MISKKLHQGFSLFELVIVVLIVGILSAMAYPSYTTYVQKSRRSDGQSALLDAAQRLEVFYSRNATYTTDLTAPEPDISAISAEGFYDIAIAGCPIASCYQITATPRATGGQNNDLVQGMRIRSDGRRQHTTDGATWDDGWVSH